jgi:putative endonuclease
MPMKRPCVYLLASKRNGTLYVGVTSDIIRRVWEHKTGAVEGFSKTYAVHRLVYVEFHESMPEAIAREKRLKKWCRAWKINLIEHSNEEWRDIYEDLVL